MPARRPTPAPERPGPARERPRPAPQAARDRSRPAPRAAPAPTIALPPRPTWKARIRANRHRLAVLGVVALVVATVAFRLVRQRWEDLPRIAREDGPAGLKSLEDGDFDLARRRLDRAARALEQLNDPDAPKLRQAADEAAIITDLAGLSLEELLEKAATSPGGWEDLKALHRGRSVLIDTHIAALPGGGSGYDLEYRVFGGGREGKIDLASVRLFKGSGLKVGDPVVFGARLDAIELGADRLWHVRLVPDSAVFVITPQGWKALEHLGWPPRDLKLEDLP